MNILIYDTTEPVNHSLLILKNMKPRIGRGKSKTKKTILEYLFHLADIVLRILVEMDYR